MPTLKTEPQQTDIVSEARGLDGWGILAMPPSCSPEHLTFDGAKRIDGLLRQLADEVERLREFAREFAFEEGDDAEGQVDTLRTFHGKSQYE